MTGWISAIWNGQTGLCLKNPKMSSTDYLDDYNYNYSIYIDDDFAPLCENHEASLFGGVFAQVFYSLIFLLSLTGNILVLWILMKYEKLKTVTDIFILNLVTSDLLFSCSLPFWAVDHAHGWIFVTCKWDGAKTQQNHEGAQRGKICSSSWSLTNLTQPLLYLASNSLVATFQ
ncbi:C-C chemokine receptor type 4-like isoform X3 [Narcine bancroftii]|uniref:C-C chemokine receptor type 4-like isoform X3 n=1 Tax=Narcine bancroftii TaxID=1343680 RepID=UPI00383163F5